MIKKLLEEESPSVKALAIELATELNMKDSMEIMIAALNNPFPNVRKISYEGLVKLSGQNIAYEYDNQGKERLEGLKKWGQWWQQYKIIQELENFIQKFPQRDIDRDKVREKIIGIYKQNKLLAKDILAKIMEYTKSSSGIMRLEAIKTLSAINERILAKKIALSLLDNDLRVQKVALTGVEKITKAKVELGVLKYKNWDQDVEKINKWFKDNLAKQGKKQVKPKDR